MRTDLLAKRILEGIESLDKDTDRLNLIENYLDMVIRDGHKPSVLSELLSFFWSSEKPKTPGRYWYKRSGYIDTCRIMQLDIDNYDTIPRTEMVEWAGPIPEPKER